MALGYGLGAVPTLCQKGHPWGRRREIGCAPKWTPQFFALLLQADFQGFEEFFWSLLMYSMLCDGNKINKKVSGGREEMLCYIEVDHVGFTIGVMRVRMIHCGDVIPHHDESLCQ